MSLIITFSAVKNSINSYLYILIYDQSVGYVANKL